MRLTIGSTHLNSSQQTITDCLPPHVTSVRLLVWSFPLINRIFVLAVMLLLLLLLLLLLFWAEMLYTSTLLLCGRWTGSRRSILWERANQKTSSPSPLTVMSCSGPSGKALKARSSWIWREWWQISNKWRRSPKCPSLLAQAMVPSMAFRPSRMWEVQKLTSLIMRLEWASTSGQKIPTC